MKLPKALIRNLYDIQKGRIETGNRIVAEIKARMGQEPSRKEDEIDPEAKRYLQIARQEYSRLADAFVLNKTSQFFKADLSECTVVTDVAMLIFTSIYVQQLEYEERMEKVIAKIVEQQPIWHAFLKDVKGCGPLMSSVIITEFDIRKAERISQFWSYAGLDVAPDGRGRGRYKEHLRDVEYTDKDGKEATKKGITFNPFLKTKLVGVLGSCFLRTDGQYRKVYDDYKHRIENHEKHKDKSKGHRHNMAIRYMMKIFLQDLWLAWRELEGMEVTAPYHEAVLGHKHRDDAA